MFRQNGQLWLFGPKFAQNLILGSEFQKINVGIRVSILEIPCVPIFSRNWQLWVFRPKLGEIAQLSAIFWFEYCWGCCRELAGRWNELGGGGWSWLDVEMSWLDVEMSWVEIEMSWVELDGAGCTVL